MLMVPGEHVWADIGASDLWICWRNGMEMAVLDCSNVGRCLVPPVVTAARDICTYFVER
jgi:hypothetical protein